MAVDLQLSNTHPFQLNQKVEIKTFEVGFEGSWHIATVVLSDGRCFHVKYDHVLFLDDGPERIVEVVSPLPGSISTRLRPLPPPASRSVLGFTYGLCVDAWKDNAWWEAVVADHLIECDQRIVFLMDSCREIRVSIENLRVTQDWDSYTGLWRRRGIWPHVHWIGFGVNGPSLLPDQEFGDGGLEIDNLIGEDCLISADPEEEKSPAPSSQDGDESAKGTTKKKSWQPVGPDILPGPEFCPTFVTEYASFGSDKRPPECVVMGVRKHLAALGWRIEFKKEKSSLRFRYISPDKTLTYDSLRILCQDLRKPVLQNCQTLKMSKRKGEDTNESLPKRRKLKLRLSTISEEESANSDSELGCATSPDSVLKLSRACSVSTRSQRKKNRTLLIPGEQCGVGSVRIRVKAAGCSKRKACFLLSTLIDDNSSECFGKILTKRRRRRVTKRKKIEELEEVEDEKKDPNDLICSVCREVGDLLCCDSCPSSFHYTCVNLERLPDGDWFCPFCCCDICGEVNCEVGNGQLLCCDHCQLKFHRGCLKTERYAETTRKCKKKKWFCSVECGDVFSGLQELVGKSIAVGEGDLTWTLLRSTEDADSSKVDDSETRTKLNSAIDVLHECFEPFKDDFSGADIVEDLTFSKKSDLKRLNFERFYTIVIEERGEVISTGNVRILGNKVAELPLVGTRFESRGQGLCRLLLHELEKQLKRFGVEKLVLPAAHSVVDMWRDNFGFQELGSADRKLLRCKFMEFEGTVTCQKLLV